MRGLLSVSIISVLVYCRFYRWKCHLHINECMNRTWETCIFDSVYSFSSFLFICIIDLINLLLNQKCSQVVREHKCFVFRFTILESYYFRKLFFFLLNVLSKCIEFLSMRIVSSFRTFNHKVLVFSDYLLSFVWYSVKVQI